MNWTDLVKSRLKNIKMSQYALAERMDTSQAVVWRYLNGKREPSLETIAKIIGHCGLSKVILYSDGMVSSGEDKSFDVQRTFSFPVLDYSQAAKWGGELDESLIERQQITTEITSGKCFWLEVEGDTMTGSLRTNFPDGCLVLVDTSKKPKNNDYVVAKLGHMDTVIFKQIFNDAGKQFLRNIEPGFFPIEVNDNCKIVGTVVDVKHHLQ